MRVGKKKELYKMMMNKRYTIAIDLGESSVIAVAGSNDEAGELQIAAIATRETKGLKAGQIENIAQVTEALSGAIAELENRLDINIQLAYGGISGEYVRCEHHNEMVVVEEPNGGVSTTDVGAIHSLMCNVQAPENDTILEYSPQNYIVDSNKEEPTPVGRFGHTLSSTFNFILCEKEALKRLNLAFKQSGIALKRCFANGVTAAEAVLSMDEMQSGVAVVDLGEGMTNVSIYYRGTLRYLASIPIGGSAINADLRSLMIQERSVERIKRESGCAMAELADSGTIEVKGRTPRDNKSIPLYNIAVAIQERVTDIIIFVHREIREAGYSDQLACGIVLTGGGANMKSIGELFSRNLEYDVRIASPDVGINDESLQLIDDPEYATVIGILRRGIEMDEKGIGKSCIAESEADTPQEGATATDESATEQNETVAEQTDEGVPQESAPVTSEESVTEANSDRIAEQSTKPDEVAESNNVKESIERHKVTISDYQSDKSKETQTSINFDNAEGSNRDDKKEDKEDKEEREMKPNPFMRFVKGLTERVNNLLSPPEDDNDLKF